MEREFYDGECLNGESGGDFHYDTIQTTQAMLRGQEVNIENTPLGSNPKI